MNIRLDCRTAQLSSVVTVNDFFSLVIALTTTKECVGQALLFLDFQNLDAKGGTKDSDPCLLEILIFFSSTKMLYAIEEPISHSSKGINYK